MIKDAEGGRLIRLADTSGLAFVDVRLQERQSWLKMADLLPGAVGIIDHERTRTTWEGQPAIRFERNYLGTSNGPWFRVEGLLTKGMDYMYRVQCGVQVAPFDDPHTTSIEEGRGNKVKWTPAIEQATTRIVESFTFGT